MIDSCDGVKHMPEERDMCEDSVGRSVAGRQCGMRQFDVQVVQNEAPQTPAVASSTAAQPQVSQQSATPAANLQVSIHQGVHNVLQLALHA